MGTSLSGPLTHFLTRFREPLRFCDIVDALRGRAVATRMIRWRGSVPHHRREKGLSAQMTA